MDKSTIEGGDQSGLRTIVFASCRRPSLFYSNCDGRFSYVYVAMYIILYKNSSNIKPTPEKFNFKCVCHIHKSALDRSNPKVLIPRLNPRDVDIIIV